MDRYWLTTGRYTVQPIEAASGSGVGVQVARGVGYGGTVGLHGIGAPLAVLQVGVGRGLSTCPLAGLIAAIPRIENRNATSRIARTKLRFDCIMLSPVKFA